MNIGVFAASSQSGRAFLSDLRQQGHEVYGFCRTSAHGKEFVQTIYDQGGIYLKRPSENTNKEQSSLFIPLAEEQIGHSYERIVEQSELIILAEPSIYFVESVEKLRDAGICEKRIPIVLSPSRTFTVPLIWNVLGEGYPVICFSTCPYSCKSPEPGVSFIKRRKRSWFASIEGNVSDELKEKLKKVFPQCIWTDLPAATSLGNIGFVFHPGTYLLNYEKIKEKENASEIYSFYMEGIAQKPAVGEMLEKLDYVRLSIADAIGVNTYFPGDEDDERKWAELMTEMRLKESDVNGDIALLREIRGKCLETISNSVVGAQFWLDYTYGVSRIVNEPLYKTIGRTPTYQKMSVPQTRYIDEDIPTGLVPMREIAKRLNIDASVCDMILDRYCEVKEVSYDDLPDLSEFSTEYIIHYLLGDI